MNRKKIFITSFMLSVFLSGYTQNWDIELAKAINPTNPISGYWKFTSASTYFISAGIPLSLLAAGFIENDPALKRRSYTILGGIAIELIVSETLKTIVDRERPAEKYPGDIFPYKDIHGRSFPSGHTSLAFAAAAGLSIQYRKWWVVAPAYLWAGSVGYSRIYLGVHYPSDVLAGAAIGIGSAYLAHWLRQKLFRQKTNN